MRNISKILGLLLLLPLFTGCNDSDDVAAIFTGKTWKLNYITVDGGHDMFPFWENEAQKTKIYDELNKNGTYNVIFEGTVEGDIIKGNIKGTIITTTGNFEGTHFSGQSFAFHGYLPIEPDERTKKLKTLEQRAYSESQTQLFIETPYRNHKMIEDILQNCRPQTKLCIAANITCEGEYIQTRTVKDWKGHVPELSKIPCIFLLYK